MGILERFEKKVEGAVSAVFARTFKGDVQPVEITARLQRELDAEAKLMSRDKRLVPNEFTVRLSQHDHDKLSPYAKTLNTELAGELRRHVALITQENHVFLGTLRDNVTLARADAADSDVRAALATVDALDWALALPHGLDTEVGAGGHPVTPEQAQQLALARIVLADPHTLVLDEATSLINPATARHLERSLAAVLAGRTVIVIAHRLFSAYDADRIAVVDGGRITELGSHDELLAADGSYAALWRSWQGRG